MSRTHPLVLRRTWHDALIRIRDLGPEAWNLSAGGKASSSRSKMFRRMMNCGYVTKPPFTITPLGERYVQLCKSYYQWPDFTLKAIQASNAAPREPS
jgi:hypothetical protein